MTRRVGRRLAVGGGILVAVFGLLVLGAYGLIQTEAGRAWMARTVAGALSTPGETEVSIDRIEGRLPQQIRLSGVSVRDRAGPWLRAATVDIDWRPLALFSRKLHVTALRVVDLAVARLPAAAAAEAGAGKAGESPRGLPALPVDVTIDRLSVDDVTLAAAVLGQPISFRIAGEAAVEDADTLNSALVMERTDGTAGRAEVRAVYTPRADRLSLNVTVNEPAGGFIARALDLPDLPAVAASLAGDGPLGDWRADLAVSADELGSLAAEVTLNRQDGTRFAMTGSARTSRPARRMPGRLLAGGLDFEVRGQWTGDQVLVVEQARFNAPALGLDLAGRLRIADLEVDARATARIKDPALIEMLVAGAAADGIAVDAEAKGPLLQPKITATASIQRLTAPGIDARQVAAELAFVPERPLDQGPLRGRIDASGTVDDLTTEALADLEPLLGRRVAWGLAGTLDLGKGVLDAGELSAQAGTNVVSGTGTFGLADGTAAADVQITLGDLTGLSPLLGIGVRGRADITAQVTATDFGARLTAKLAGELREVGLDNALADALLGGRAAVATDLALGPDGGLTLANLKIEAPGTRLVGEATLTDTFARIEATYALSVADAAVLSAPLGVRIAGRGDIRGRVDGAIGNPGFTGRLALTDARLQGVDLGRIDSTFSAENVATDPRGKIALSATPAAGALDLSAGYVVADAEIRLTELRLQSQGATADGTLIVPTDGTPATGTLRIAAASLSPWLALAGIGGGGSATAELRLSGDGPRQAADLKGNLTGLTWRAEDGQVLRAERAEVTLRTTDLTDSLAGRAVVQATDVTFGELRLDRLSLSGAGDRAQATLQLQTAGRFRGPLALNATAALRADKEQLTLALTGLDGQAIGQPVTLRAPATLTRRSNAIDLSRLDLAFGPARIRAAARIDAERVTGDLAVDGLPIASLEALTPTQGVTGTISGAVTVAGSRANPSGEGRLDVANLKVDAASGVPPLGLDLTGTWRDRRLKLAGRLTGMPEREAELAADVPLRLDPDRLAFTVPAAEPMSGRLSWQGDMAAIWPLVPLDAHRLAGATEITATLAGSLATPEVSGTLRLSNGTYENLETGTLLKDVEIGLDVADNRAVLTRFTASDGAKGRLSATGEAAVDPRRGYPFKIETDMTEFVLLRRDDVTAVSDGRLALEGSLERVSLVGQFETRVVEVRIVDRLPAEVATLDVVETDSSATEKTVRETQKKSAAGPDIVLDVAVAMPRRVFVRGRGLDSEWAGDLKVTGTARTPIVKGELSVVRGNLSVLTKSFRLKNGSVRFPGGREIIPQLDVQAEHKAQDLTVTARASGPATNPSISFTSVPDLPQDEIVARVLFDRGAAQLGALEAAQLAAALAELTGTGGGLGALDFARSLLGVDVLRIETPEPGVAGGPGVEAGKYVAEGVYVGVKKGITDETGAVGVEIELTPNISVESQTGATGESDLGIKFKWDY